MDFVATVISSPLEALSEGRSENGLVPFTGESSAHPQRGSPPFQALLGRSPEGRSSQTTVSLPGFIGLSDLPRAGISGWRHPPPAPGAFSNLELLVLPDDYLFAAADLSELFSFLSPCSCPSLL